MGSHFNSRARRCRRRTCQQSAQRGCYRHRQFRSQRGAAVVELAVLLPLLAFLFVVALDFGRAFYFSLTLENCARAGALYARDPHVADESPFTSAEEAALADATNLSPSPTITTANGTDAAGRDYVEVTADYSFKTILQFPDIPSELTLSRSVQMYQAPITPNST